MGKTSENQRISLIKGDGIGPEICEAVQSVFEKAGVNIHWDPVQAGLAAIEKTGHSIDAQCLERLKHNKITLKGPTTTPVGSGHRSINVIIRKALDLYVNLRPIRNLPGVETAFSKLKIDIIIVRENIEDTYGGIEHRQSEDVAQCLRLITKSGSLRCHRYAFEMARREKRKRVTCVHKANIMKITDGLFLESFREVAKDFPDIEATDIIVDNCCMQLVTRPDQFDVLVLPNLFGDIVSDLCAGLVGGLGIASGANLGKDCAVFEAVHGSAPDIAGKGLANPTAILFSSVTMLRHMGEMKFADKIERALLKTLESPAGRTKDLGGKASTLQFTNSILSNL